jgi:N6-adenosine-specific RNA methylase IME4/ParB-like chromosome segregation protein Spo0J
MTNGPGLVPLKAPYQLLDPLLPAEYAALEADIRKRGVMVPVEKDEDGNILDGHHRQEIADRLGLPCPAVVRHFASEQAKREHVLKLNLARRHMDPVRWGRAFKRLLEERGVTPGRGGDRRSTATVAVDTVADIAAELGVPERTARHRVQQAEQYDALPAEEKSAVDAGEKSVREAQRDAVRAAVRHEQEDRLARFGGAPPLPDGKYRCLVVDPPWPLKKSDREVCPEQGRLLDYPTMSVEQIVAMKDDIDRLSHDDCHLYLWTTQRFLPDALDVLEAWGFKYHCQFTWVKPTGFTPFTFMFNSEHVLFAWRGNLKVERQGLKVTFEAPVVGHSVKPDVFYDTVRQASPGPRLDMFNRRPLEGFDVWGNEAGAKS